MMRMTRSVVICIDALENHRPSELRQNPGIDGSQNLATGTQLRKALRTAQVPYVANTAIMSQQMRRIRLVGKTRKYCIRIEALAQSKAAL